MAFPKALPLLCFLGFFFLFSISEAEAAKPDFFYLTLTWPGTLCSNSRCCMPTTTAPAVDFFVEGFKGYDSATGKPVTNCYTSSCRFFVNSLRPFISDMYAHWPDVSCPSNNGVDLWRSAWCTYGTCSNLTQAQYFQGALNLTTAKIDLLYVLSFYGIVPSKTKSYTLEEIEESLLVNYGFSTVVECRQSGRFSKYDRLSKFRFCVSADAQRLISCPNRKSSNCAATVKFPPFSLDMLEPCLGSEPVMMSSDQTDSVM